MEITDSENDLIIKHTLKKMDLEDYISKLEKMLSMPDCLIQVGRGDIKERNNHCAIFIPCDSISINKSIVGYLKKSLKNAKAQLKVSESIIKTYQNKWQQTKTA